MALASPPGLGPSYSPAPSGVIPIAPDHSVEPRTEIKTKDLVSCLTEGKVVEDSSILPTQRNGRQQVRGVVHM